MCPSVAPDRVENEISRVSGGTVQAMKCQGCSHQRRLYHFHRYSSTVISVESIRLSCCRLVVSPLILNN